MLEKHPQPKPSYTRAGFPRLYVSRHGVYYWRERNRWVSLYTKDPREAAIIAMGRNLQIARQRQERERMSMVDPNYPRFRKPDADDDHQRFEIDIRRGIYKTNGTPEDAQAMRETLELIKTMPAPGQSEEDILREAIESVRPKPAPLRSPPLSEVIDAWLVERGRKNAPRTVYAKKNHLEDFCRRIASRSVEINAIVKAVVVGYKAALLSEGQTGKTIDNKLLTLHDFFKYALANGHYTASHDNPVSGLFVLTKTERQKQAQSYQQFTPDDLKALFEPTGYKAWADAPDLWFAPLIALFTGMRISEATAIAVADVKQVEDSGVHYIEIPASKTVAGIRNVPICDALIGLGFLQYVEEARAAGLQRLFQHRPLIHGAYSKRLSERFRERLTAVEIKDQDKSFHSFRVNVITALANNGANTAQTFKITGHKDRSDADTHLGYVRGLPKLKAVLDGLQWPIDLSALKYLGEFAAFLARRKWESERRGGRRA